MERVQGLTTSGEDRQGLHSSEPQRWHLGAQNNQSKHSTAIPVPEILPRSFLFRPCFEFSSSANGNKENKQWGLRTRLKLESPISSAHSRNKASIWAHRHCTLTYPLAAWPVGLLLAPPHHGIAVGVLAEVRQKLPRVEGCPRWTQAGSRLKLSRIQPAAWHSHNMYSASPCPYVTP